MLYFIKKKILKKCMKILDFNDRQKIILSNFFFIFVKHKNNSDDIYLIAF